MIQARRLVEAIEAHSDELTALLVRQLKEHHQTISYRRVGDIELASRVRNIYGHLGFWIRSSSELQLEDVFLRIGRERCREGIPLSEVVAGQLLTRQNLWAFIDGEPGDSVLELRGELDLQILVVRFFDRAIYHTVRGYEAEVKEQSQSRARAEAVGAR
jgi:hypothetical protein